MTEPVLNHMPTPHPEETTTPVYARFEGGELQVGVLRVVPGVNAAVDIDPQALVTARGNVAAPALET